MLFFRLHNIRQKRIHFLIRIFKRRDRASERKTLGFFLVGMLYNENFFLKYLTEQDWRLFNDFFLQNSSAFAKSKTEN